MFQRLKRGGWPYSQPPSVPFDVNRASPQAEGLVAWWPMLGGQGGWPVRDRVQDRFPMTAFNTPAWIADGERGWSVLFDDGASEYLSLDKAPVVEYPFTLAAWVYTDDLANIQCLLQIADKDVADQYWGIFLDDDGRHARFITVDGAADNCDSVTSYSANAWHHVCGVAISNTSRAVFLDGGGKGTVADDLTPVGLDRVTIGRTGDSTPAAYMSGRISDVRIYNVAKSDGQVYQMATNPWELIRPRTRRLWAMAPGAPPAGAMPMAMDHYRRRRV